MIVHGGRRNDGGHRYPEFGSAHILTWGPVTGVENPFSAPSLGLRVQPNPASGTFVVGFVLPGAGPTTIELWDVQGRRLDTRDLGVLGPGPQSVTFSRWARPAPGVYLVRLVQGRHHATARTVVID
jgi:hypothetical protein